MTNEEYKKITELEYKAKQCRAAGIDPEIDDGTAWAMNKREIVQATVRDFSRLSYEAQQFVLGYMVARANCTANATTPADQPEQKKPA